jgi:hypothetical protein
MIFLLLFSIVSVKNDENIIRTSANIALSNKKIGWGIKRAKNLFISTLPP